MNKLYDLKDTLCRELEEYGQRGEISAGDLDAVDTLAHAIKNIDKIIGSYEEEDYSRMGNSYRTYERTPMSYARGRGRNAKRDSRGRYASDDGMIDQLYDMMNDANDEKTRHEIQKMISRLESN